MLSEFEFCHQIRPRIRIRYGGQATVERRWRMNAGATEANTGGDRQSAGLAARDGLSKQSDAVFAHGFGGPGVAYRTLA